MAFISPMICDEEKYRDITQEIRRRKRRNNPAQGNGRNRRYDEVTRAKELSVSSKEPEALSPSQGP
jgi:hypothetical protein